MPVDAPWRWVPVPSSELEELCQSNSTGPSLETGAPPNELRTCAVKCAGPNLPIGDDASTLSTDTPEKQRARIAGPSLQTSALPLGYGANYLLRLELKWGLTVTEGSDFGKGQRRAIPPMVLSHPNYHDNRSFSSSSALVASARAPAWERLAGPESR